MIDPMLARYRVGLCNRIWIRSFWKMHFKTSFCYWLGAWILFFEDLELDWVIINSESSGDGLEDKKWDLDFKLASKGFLQRYRAKNWFSKCEQWILVMNSDFSKFLIVSDPIHKVKQLNTDDEISFWPTTS